MSKHPEWLQLVEDTREAPYGKSFTHEELAAVLQVPVHSPRYYAMIQRWKDELLSRHRRYVEANYTVGYRIVLPKEHVGAMRNWVERAAWRVKKAIEIGVATPTEMLNREENARLGDTLRKQGSLLSMFGRVRKQTDPFLPLKSLQALPDRPKMLKKG